MDCYSVKINCINKFLFLFIATFLIAHDSQASDEEKNKEPDITSVQATQVYSVSSTVDLVYAKPKLFTFVKSIPKDMGRVYKASFRKENIPLIAMIFVETATLIPADQNMLDGAKSIGRSLNISPTSHQQTVFDPSIKLKNKNLKLPLGFPTDLNSSMYFLGDGIMHTTISLGFVGYGLIAKNYRALQTGSQVAEAMIASGIVVQFLKHVTGRESPFASTARGGVWRVFPNQTEYANHVPQHDAYPSGHIATAVGTVTVIGDNYPEYKLIKPVGYSLCGLLAFAMMNNGVHWASDYPLGISLGYIFGKVVVAHGRSEIKKDTLSHNAHSKLNFRRPYVTPEVMGGVPACSFRWVF